MKSKMIRVGINPCKLIKNESFNDMGSFFVSSYEPPNWFWVSVQKWNQIRLMEDCDMGSKDQLSQAINISGGSLVHQFNAITPNKAVSEYIRVAICVGESRTVKWSWFDAYIKLPVLKVVASFMNFIRTPITKNEQKKWDEYMERGRFL